MREHKAAEHQEQLILPPRPKGEVPGSTRDLSLDQIREWVDVYRGANVGKFPSRHSGEILNADGSQTGETWRGLNSLFNSAQKGFPSRGLRSSGFESLADFLDKTYPGERLRKPDLLIEQIKGWVEVYRAANDGKFPNADSGEILNADGSETGETWKRLDALFRKAQEGARARGLKGLGFESLADFLDKTYPDERKVRIEKPDLSIDQIRGWVGVYRAGHDGKFPSMHNGEVLNADGSPTGETWAGLNSLFNSAQKGVPSRGLRSSGFESLADFLDKTYPGERLRKQDLLIEQIQAWVDVYRAANDRKFPSASSGEVLNTDGSQTGETWRGLEALFRTAQKGLHSRGLGGFGFKSLADFLDNTYPEERKVRVRIEKQDLSIKQIKVWVDVFRAANDRKFPSSLSGEIRNADGSPTGETWKGLDDLFRTAQKGLHSRGLGGFGFKSLADFLDNTYPEERKVRVRIEKQDLSIKQIKVWVEVYRAANDRKFPSASSGEVLNTDGSQTGETWRGLDALFRTAQQGLHSRGLGGFGFKSLRDFLDKTYPGEREVQIEKADLSIKQIKVWVDVYREANDGKFPSTFSGGIINADGSPTGETWGGLNALFRTAQKGFPSRGLQHSGFTSLSDFLDKTYPTERARERRAATVRPEVDDINVLLDLLE